MNEQMKKIASTPATAPSPESTYSAQETWPFGQPAPAPQSTDGDVDLEEVAKILERGETNGDSLGVIAGRVLNFSRRGMYSETEIEKAVNAVWYERCLPNAPDPAGFIASVLARLSAKEQPVL